MTTMTIQTVHGVSSPVIRGIKEDDKQSPEEPPAENTTQLYREETAVRLEELNQKAKG